MNDPLVSTRPRLFLNHAAELNKLVALEFGRVDDGQPEENFEQVADSGFYWHVLEPDGPCAGFAILDFSDFDAEADAVAEIWSGPRFDAPLVGLTDASAGEIALAAKVFFGGRPSVNRRYFNAAAGTEGKEALVMWRNCLETGDSMAHFGLGYTLYELGHHLAAYLHLRHYTEIAPEHPWNWVWFAKAAAAIGESAEAQRACRRAIELTEAGREETDAPELLAELEAEESARQKPPAADDRTEKEDHR